jgi:hypothetical protein
LLYVPSCKCEKYFKPRQIQINRQFWAWKGAHLLFFDQAPGGVKTCFTVIVHHKAYDNDISYDNLAFKDIQEAISSYMTIKMLIFPLFLMN